MCAKHAKEDKTDELKQQDTKEKNMNKEQAQPLTPFHTKHTHLEVLLHLVLQEAGVVSQVFAEPLHLLIHLDQLHRITIMVPVRGQTLHTKYEHSFTDWPTFKTFFAFW